MKKLFIIFLFLIASHAQASTLKGLDNTGLVGYWSFDEGFGTSILDYSGNNRNATTSSTTFDYGKVKDSLLFAGTKQVNFIPSTTRTQTITFWFKSGQSTAISPSIDSFKIGSFPEIRFDWNDTVHRMYVCNADEECKLQSIPPNIYNDEGWHFFAIASDDTIGYVYVDNQPVRTLSSWPTGNSDPVLFSKITSSSGIVGARIDELREYNRVLSASEISKIYMSQASGLIIPPLSNFGLVGFWSLDENRGTKTLDFSGNNYIGTFFNSPTWNRGRFSGGVKTDGSSSYVQMVTPTKLQYTASDPFSFTGWFKPGATTGVNTYLGMFGYNQGVTDGWGVFEINGFGICTHCFEYCYFPGTYYACANSFDNSASNNRWRFVVITNDSSNLHTGRKMYIDGVLQTAGRVDGALGGDGLPDINYSSNHLQIGTRDNQSGSYWNGTSDDIRVYNYELTQDQVNRLYHEQSAYHR